MKFRIKVIDVDMTSTEAIYLLCILGGFSVGLFVGGVIALT